MSRDTSNRTIPRDDLTSAALVALMRLSFAADGLDLGSRSVITAGPFASLTDKNAIADHVLAHHGAAPLLRVGMQVAKMAADPIGAVLLAARNGPDLIGRWQRLERFVHTRHPIQSVRISKTTAHLRHRRAAGHDHSAAMDLVLASVIAGLLTAVGCADLVLELGRGAAQVVAIDRGRIRLKGSLPPRLGTDEWLYHWTTAPGATPGTLETKGLPHRPHLAAEVKALFARDLLNVWTLAGVSTQLGLSTRTLQRRLAGDGHTLQGLRRAVQIDHATHLLHTTSYSLTVIGYACGFSDSAHFTRSFKAAAGLPPTAYRAARGDRRRASLVR